jgi:membrane-associated PAP2 superfamily phosphatase
MEVMQAMMQALKKTMDATVTVIVVEPEMRMKKVTMKMARMRVLGYPQSMRTTHVLSHAEWAIATRNARTAWMKIPILNAQ